jgi:hypothetical protein
VSSVRKPRTAAFEEYPDAKVRRAIRGMKYSTVKLRIGFTGLWEGIFKDGKMVVFMRNYTD